MIQEIIAPVMVLHMFAKRTATDPVLFLSDVKGVTIPVWLILLEAVAAFSSSYTSRASEPIPLSRVVETPTIN
jgi:hypothetical protein